MGKNSKAIFVLVVLLVAASLIILVNNFVYDALTWLVADVLYLVIALLFSFTVARTSKCGFIIAVLLWIPVLIVAYMLSRDIFALFIENDVWLAMNMYQLLLYGYVIGQISDHSLKE